LALLTSSFFCFRRFDTRVPKNGYQSRVTSSIYCREIFFEILFHFRFSGFLPNGYTTTVPATISMGGGRWIACSQRAPASLSPQAVQAGYSSFPVLCLLPCSSSCRSIARSLRHIVPSPRRPITESPNRGLSGIHCHHIPISLT